MREGEIAHCVVHCAMHVTCRWNHHAIRYLGCSPLMITYTMGKQYPKWSNGESGSSIKVRTNDQSVEDEDEGRDVPPWKESTPVAGGKRLIG